jgi:glycyl-tRNA synthetase
MFVNFKRLNEFNQGKMPFAAAQVGLAFRNEIAPRGGLLRVREFCMAEIEHFVNPSNKAHPRFANVANKTLTLFSSDAQMGTGRTTRMSIGDAVAQNIVDNETLGYFMARTQLFLEKIGMDPNKMRFRQHLVTEMAHYASDCWDMEILTTVAGWVECVGHADRACYDLDVHGKKTKTSMLASERLATPQLVEVVKAVFDKKTIGKAFKKEQKNVVKAVEELSEDKAKADALDAQLNDSGSAVVEGTEYTITREMVSFEVSTKNVHEVKFTPSVVEPSFGIGRVLACLFEHSYYTRAKDEQMRVMAFPPSVAPIKVGIYNMQSNDSFVPVVAKISSLLREANISHKVDTGSVTIGRKYARSDETGTPFGLTVDFGTLEDDAITVRERDTTSQCRVPIAEVVSLLTDLVSERLTWDDVRRAYPVVYEGDDAGEEKATEGAAAGDRLVCERNIRGAFMRPTDLAALMAAK